jgi:hypothetical protein
MHPTTPLKRRIIIGGHTLALDHNLMGFTGL